MVQLRKLDLTDRDIAAVIRINDEAFPPSEHMPVDEMFAFTEKCDSKVFGIYDGAMPVGFTMTVQNEKSVYVFFLAVDPELRGRGYGSQTVEALFREFADHQVVLDFEELDPSAENYAQRVRRKDFYLRNGFHETGRYTMLRGERFEVVCNAGPLDSESFFDIVQTIHVLLPVFPGILI